jgi:hypothetical protein
MELDRSIESWRVQYIGVGRPRGGDALVPSPLRQPLWAEPNTHAGGGPTTQPLQMLRLHQNSLDTEEGSPFVKMSANCDVIGTWRTQT